MATIEELKAKVEAARAAFQAFQYHDEVLEWKENALEIEGCGWINQKRVCHPDGSYEYVELSDAEYALMAERDRLRTALCQAEWALQKAYAQAYGRA